MRNFLYFCLGAVVLFTACEDKETPYNEFEDLTKGAIPRLVSAPSGIFDFFNPDDSQISFEVEFYDENEGRNVASYAWDVSYADDSTSAGPVNLLTLNKGDFQTNSAGLPGANITFRLNDVLSALGLSIDDVDGGNNFSFSATLTKDDGSVFTGANTSPNLKGQPAFNAFFNFNQPLVCPSDLGGSYVATSEGESTDGCCAGTFMSDGRIITLTDLGGGNYTISDWSGGLYLAWYGPDAGNYGITEAFIEGGGMSTTIIDACNTISIAEFSEPFGAAASAGGSLDPDTGIITYTFENGFGDVGRVTLTPQ